MNFSILTLRGREITGSMCRMQVLKEYQIITNNGYIYNVDRVLEPLETIYDVLKKKSDYSDFLNFIASTVLMPMIRTCLPIMEKQ